MVGLWTADPSMLMEERIRAAVGGDLYVNSLRDAMDACLAAARQPVDAAGDGRLSVAGPPLLHYRPSGPNKSGQVPSYVYSF